MIVLHIISGLDGRFGGPIGALSGLANAQVSQGLDVRIHAMWAEGDQLDLVNRLRQNKIAVTLTGPGTGALRRHPDIAKTLHSLVNSSNIVHIHALWEEVHHIAARQAFSARVPYLIRPCGMLDPWSLSQSRWRKKIYMAWRLRKNLNQAAAIHFTSETERDLTGPLHLKAPSIVEPNGVELDEFQHPTPENAFRSRWPAIGDRRILLFLSRIHVKKGIDLLVPAFAKANLENTVLVIAGPDDDGYGAAVRRMVEQHHLQDRVIFTGMLRGADRIAAFSEAELFTLPSYSENFGISVVEALAAGTPVVISDQVNIHDRISAAGVGGVVPLNVDSLATELRRWMSDDTLRCNAASRAKDFVWLNYDWRQIARRWAGHYERLIASGKTAQPRR